MTVAVNLEVNGEPVRLEAEARTHLADALRDGCGLTGTHLGCEHGVCGACTVLLDGQPVRSCITFVAACEGVRVRTVEGLAEDPLIAALREAFSVHHALQCGYCTPGMLITAYDIARRLPEADSARVRRELAGNLCRCTGYQGIVNAVLDVVAKWPRGELLNGVDGDGSGALLEPLPAPPALAALPIGSLPKVGAPDAGGAGLDMLASASAEAGALAFGLDSSGGESVERRLVLDVSADALWASLRDVDAVVRCMPGLALVDEPRPVPGQAGGDDSVERSAVLSVAIGPMRARFEALSVVSFDEPRRRGRITGRGEDKVSRTTAEGTVAFRVSGDERRSELAVSLDYQLQGGLAQYSRGAVVDAVTDELLARFAVNVARLTRGETVASVGEVGGGGLALAAFWNRLRRFFF